MPSSGCTWIPGEDKDLRAGPQDPFLAVFNFARCWAAAPTCLKERFYLLQNDFDFPRDYLLPLPDARRDGFI